MINWLDSKIKKMDVFDISLLEISVFAFALMLAKLIPGIMILDWYWYGLAFLVTGFWLVFKVFSPQGRQFSH